jgi:GTP cyclohydrolase I
MLVPATRFENEPCMNNPLPDVASHEHATTLLPLDWVGMRGIDIPLNLDQAGVQHPVHALADLQVDLPAPHIKGIHMSRLYTLLDHFAEHQAVSPASLSALLKLMVSSHAECQSTQARLSLSFKLLCKRAALVTAGLSGWKSYPVVLQASLHDRRMVLNASVEVAYSSTCPCSAALSRQLLEQAFVAQFGDDQVSAAEVAEWLRRNGSHATPHSQRSVAEITVCVPEDAESIDLLALIDLAESVLGTPVQTAVKRADEQAFARLNGQHLMYVEDAARKLQQALALRYRSSSVNVRHLESLHPHDAVASASDNVLTARWASL